MHQRQPPIRTAGRPTWVLALVIVAWLGAAVSAWYAMSAFGFSGQLLADEETLETWPEASSISRSPRQPTLLLFLHPRCSCSRASVEELARLYTLVPQAALPAIAVVASAPRAVGDQWWSSSLLARTARLPNVHMVYDADGVETARFGAQLSGTVLLYHIDGRRLYAGGVTMARGQDGHNAGIQAVADLLVNSNVQVAPIPVFGCKVVRETGTQKSADVDGGIRNDRP